MENLNTLFLEEYKRLDKLLCDAYDTHKGVSTYLECMKSYGEMVRFRIPEWAEDYQTLHRLRQIRNNMSHDVGTLLTASCTHQDILWLMHFRQRIISSQDPVALAERSRKQPSSPQAGQKPESYNSISYIHEDCIHEEPSSQSDKHDRRLTLLICVIFAILFFAILGLIMQ